MPLDRQYIAKFKKQIRHIHGCSSSHFTSVPVTLRQRGRNVWNGNVEVFDIFKHPQAHTCYAWAGEHGVTTMLAIAPALSPETAVKTALSQGIIPSQ